MEKYIKLVADITHEDLAAVRERMDRVQRLYGLTYKEFYQNELYSLSEGWLTKKALKIQQRKQNRKNAFHSVTTKSKMSRKEIIQEIKRINEKGIFKINIFFYEKFSMYKLQDEELEKVLHLLVQRNALLGMLKKDLQLIDQGELQYADLEEKLNQFYEIIGTLITDGFREKMKNLFFSKRRDGSIHEGNQEDIIVDMEVARLLLGFSFPEYISFRFEEKSLQEKRTYISNRERMGVLSMLNNDEASELLNHKVESYNLLKKYYRRKQVYIKDENDYPAFKAFCEGLDVFVKKSVALSMGKGIEPIYIQKDTDLHGLMCSLLEESGSFAAEELILLHRKIKALNPTSVNTVRLETYFDGKKTIIGDAFMRVGQSGAFVDNAGAGGIFVAVDPKTGVITSDGFDEYGNVYVSHPDTGIVFKGYRLPGWSKALRLCHKISHQVPGVQFIGWDLAYTNRRKWVVVEGNAKPQIICNQTSQGKGLKHVFLQRVNMKEE